MKKIDQVIFYTILLGVVVLLSTFAASLIEVLWFLGFKNIDHYLFHSVLGFLLFLLVILRQVGLYALVKYRYFIFSSIIYIVVYVYYGIVGVKKLAIISLIFAFVDFFYNYRISRLFNFVLFVIYLNLYKIYKIFR